MWLEKVFAIFAILSTSRHFTLVEGQSSTKTSVYYTAESILPLGILNSPRGVTQDDAGDILVVTRGTSYIQAVFQEDDTVKTAIIIEGSRLNLNHGIVYKKGYLYASNSSQVLRWRYTPGQRSRISAEPEVIVREVPSGGDHATRTIIIDEVAFLYVSVGSAQNDVADPQRAQIRRFNLLLGIPSNGYVYEDGELFVDGVRNTVGLAIDGKNKLWGVDCGPDNLYREDLGGDIHNTNPADKLIRFSQNASYGYPYCWTVDQLNGHSRGEQMAWPSYMKDGVHSDAWCQNTKNNAPPTLSLPAHNAPIGITFYDGVGCNFSTDSFPCSMKGDIFVAFHGSWNREPPAGYKVVRIPVNPSTQLPSGDIEDIIYEINPNSCASQPSKCFRPVDLLFDSNGHLIITSDTSSELIKVRRKVSGEKDEEKKIAVMAILAVAFVALFTGVLIGMIARRFCCLCCPAKEIPYQREQI